MTRRRAAARYRGWQCLAAGALLCAGLLYGGSLTATSIWPPDPPQAAPPPLATYDAAVHMELLHATTLLHALQQTLAMCVSQRPGSGPATAAE